MRDIHDFHTLLFGRRGMLRGSNPDYSLALGHYDVRFRVDHCLMKGR